MKPEAPPPHPLRVLIVDDHEVVHWGIRIMLGRLPWVGGAWSARSGEEAVATAVAHEVDLALVDLFIGAESGAEISEALLAARPQMRILLISGAGQISARAAATCGASGFISKDQSAGELVRAVRAVAEGGSLFEEELEPPAGPRLSAREAEVLSALAAGETNRQIAARLHLSPHTVKEYASALYRKLEVENRLQAIRRAEKLGLIG